MEVAKPFFLLNGPQGAGQHALSQYIAQYCHCIHLQPASLIRDSLQEKSKDVLARERLLYDGDFISGTEIIRLLNAKISSDEVRCKGLFSVPFIHYAIIHYDDVGSVYGYFNLLDLLNMDTINGY